MFGWDDWEDDETAIEKWLGDMAGWATGSEAIGDR